MNPPTDQTSEDTDRRITLINAGMDPAKAEQLSAVIRRIENETNDPTELAYKREAVLHVLIEQGLDMYSAFTVLYCAPSQHENTSTQEADHASTS